MVTKINQFIPLAEVNSDGHED